MVTIHADTEPLYIAPPGGTCGAAPRLMPWAATSTYAFGPLHIGVRASTLRLKALLDEVLADRLVTDGRAPDNFSVDLGDATAGASSFFFLLRGSEKLVRTRDISRLVLGLLRHLEAFLPPMTEEPLLETGLAALVRNGRAVLLPRAALSSPEIVGRRLYAHGVLTLDAPYVAVSPVTRSLVVPALSTAIPAQARSRLEELAPAGAREQVVGPGRYPIVGIVGFVAEPGDSFGLAHAVHSAVAHLARPADPAQTLAAAVALCAELPRLGLPMGKPGEIATSLLALSEAVCAGGPEHG